MDWRTQKSVYSSGIFNYLIFLQIITFVSSAAAEHRNSLAPLFNFVHFIANSLLIYRRGIVDDLNLDERKLLARARSDASILNLGGCDVCSEETEIDLIESNDSSNFTSVFDRLGLESSREANEREDDMIPEFGDRGTQTCTCENCSANDDTTRCIKSREISTMRLVVQGPEILNYQGIQYTPEDIARYWKKDSRMWLWKSVRLARRKMSETAKSPPIDCLAKSQREDVP